MLTYWESLSTNFANMNEIRIEWKVKASTKFNVMHIAVPALTRKHSLPKPRIFYPTRMQISVHVQVSQPYSHSLFAAQMIMRGIKLTNYEPETIIFKTCS